MSFYTKKARLDLLCDYCSVARDGYEADSLLEARKLAVANGWKLFPRARRCACRSCEVSSREAQSAERNHRLAAKVRRANT
jgi:hypothetical protein